MENKQKVNEKHIAEVIFEGLVAGAVAGAFGMSFITNSKLKQLEDKVDSLSPKPITSNVIGNGEPEKFYDVNGQRVYLEIDGKPVEQYFKK